MNDEMPQRINFLPILIGVIALVPGILVYFIDRPPGQTYFINHLPFEMPFDISSPYCLGYIGFVLPDFIHVFSLSLITAGVLSMGRSGDAFSCLTWFLIDSLFEIGQKFGHTIATFIPGWFKRIPYLENTANYFKRGTFDWLDLLAILVGAGSAYAILLMIRNRSTKS